MAFVAPGEDRPVDLSIIVISYNTQALTLKALESLFQYPPPVDFDLSPYQATLRDASRELLDYRCAPTRVRAVHDRGAGFGKSDGDTGAENGVNLQAVIG